MSYLTATGEEKEILRHLLKRKQVNPLEFFEHLPMQALFHKDQAKSKNIFGGNRSSKTQEGIEYILEKGLKSKLRIWACAETFPDSVNIQQRKMWELIPKNRIKYGRYDEINGFVNRKVLLDNGTLYVFKSYDQKRESFQGDDVDIILNDEEPPWDIYREQRMRLIDRDGEMVITMTSLKGVTDLIQSIFEGHDVIKAQYAPLVKKILPRIVRKGQTKFYLFWTTENPYIDQKRLLHEATLMTKQEILARVYGIPINLTGRIYMKFSTDIHVMPLEEAPILRGGCTIYHVLDPHDAKPWAMQWIAVHPTGTAYIFDEYPNENFNEILYDDKSYDDYAEIIREKEDAIRELTGKSVFKRIIDPNFGNKTIRLAEKEDTGQSRTTTKKELQKRGFKFVDGIDPIESGHLKVREKIDWKANDDGEIIKQPGTMWTDNCVNSIRHMSRYSRKDMVAADGDVKDKVPLQEKYKDFCDLTRYFWMSDPYHFEGKREFNVKAKKIY